MTLHPPLRASFFWPSRFCIFFSSFDIIGEIYNLNFPLLTSKKLKYSENRRKKQEVTHKRINKKKRARNRQILGGAGGGGTGVVVQVVVVMVIVAVVTRVISNLII